MRTAALPRNVILTGDAVKRLRELPTASVDAVITSPPYFNLRNYGVENQLGLEANVDEWVDNLRQVMVEVARVLKPTGSVWLNLGDSYSRHANFGAPPKSLLMGPERLALALIADGWTIRNKVIWAKTRAMPSSATDRLTCTWEVVYLLTRSSRYHLDLDVIRQPHRSAKPHRSTTSLRSVGAAYPPPSASPPRWAGPLAGNNSGLARLKAAGLLGHPLGSTPRDVWALPSANFKGPHFATFPQALIERPLLASVPERVCARCGKPWERDHARFVGELAVLGHIRPSCTCHKGWRPGVVLDPFFGAGTVGLVAEEQGRDWLGIELNPDFVALANERITTARKGVTTTNPDHSSR